ncbi:site-specific integrase [Xanthomonas translucens]|uniref:site-specific integrase n=1 Tax=Xanthomonas campestris pv. translucens TaxID=343 RepID=UPI0021B80B8F|nr:integrase [Xanthomonas translucens]MCT8273386.1 integrase [Xanthomonas translucens pv. translucens]MCT8277470.1 integrase [Xanthomonas translucens pv. translucens]MCT8306337.1 integrase [Xanthomonas translucens pv. translucens]WNJ27841.1 integrase [Xanthomonas translucens pv. translucens]
MGRGRKRKYNPDIPRHIDQDALPKGVYWADQRWYIREPHPEGGRPKNRTIGYADARLSDLHAAKEISRGAGIMGTLQYVANAFKESTEYRDLSKNSRDDYDHHAELACDYILKDGSTLGQLLVDRMSVPLVQRLVEALAKGRPARGLQPAMPARPSTANHVLRYLRRLFAWGVRIGHCKTNPASGVRAARERGETNMPDPQSFLAVLEFAKHCAALPLHAKGAVPPYMPAVMVLAYNARLRGIEVTDLTDADALKRGVRSSRRKGSRDNITKWNEDLEWAWTWLREYRTRRMQAHKRPMPMRPEKRVLLVTQTGTPLARSTLKTAWQRLITAALEKGVIDAEARFTLHGLKHRGITDTKGTRAHKQDAAGHVMPQTTNRYDHELQLVAPPMLPTEEDELAFPEPSAAANDP